MAYIPRLKARDELAWGQLVKSWATGRNYVGYEDENNPVPPDDSPYTVPKDFTEFATQCVNAKVGLVFKEQDGSETDVDPNRPKYPITLVVPTKWDSSVFILRLPPKDKIDETESKLKNGTPYLLGDFYAQVFKCLNTGGGENSDCKLVMDGALLDTNVKRFNFHALRVGDYTIAGCM